MASLLAAPWIVVVLPYVLGLVVLAVGRVAKPAAPFVAALGPLVVVAFALAALGAIPAEQTARIEPWTSAIAAHGGFEWFRVGDSVLRVGWTVDTLATLMLLVVGFVALMVVIFSAGYMHGDRGWNRYFALLCLFTGSMSLLVIGDSFTTLFIGWELVGACSYLLIGFWYEKPSAAAAAIKAFLTTRVGDVGLLFGIAVLWMATGSLGYTAVMERLPQLAPGVIAAAAVLIAIGAIGKSAQFPLHIWLPDAMEGPTPVSALIHAATMVAAGVYLVARTWPLFEAAPAARTLLLWVGVISGLGAALIGLFQNDIKKVLAYSTISQLGFMFAALGVGAWEIAFFHLVAHAAFKALLFLTSGSVIHGSGTQDLRDMGGLRSAMPITFVAWLVGSAALMGIPPMAGFFSKDAVLDAVWLHSPAAGVMLFAAALCTGFYIVRATKLAFFGTWRGEGHAHESGWSMLGPLMLLSVPAIGLGFAGPWFAEKLGEHPEPLSIVLSAVAVGLGLLGGVVAWATVRVEAPDERAVAPGWQRVLVSGFGYDAAVTRFVVHPTVSLSRGLWALVDRFLIDGIVEGSAVLARWVSSSLSRAQSGDGQNYATAMVLSVVVVLAALLLAVR